MNMDQATLAAREGMDRALRAERVSEWKRRAGLFIELIPVGCHFVADDLVWSIGLPDSGPAKNNVVGAFFSALARRGAIEFTGRFVKSDRVEGHGNLQRVWRRTSLVESEQGWHRPGPDSTSERVADTPPVAVAPCGARSLAPEQLTLEATG